MTDRTVFDYLEDNAGRGWQQFPCATNKQPRTKNGFHDATLDLDLLRDHWVQNPDDCIGIRTGFGLLVIDVDDYKPGGVASWAELLGQNPPLPRTFTVQTGQGGTQFYYSVTEEIRGNGVRLAQNVDVRCDGGYVIGAGSHTIYGPYVVVDSSDIAPLPSWLLALVLSYQRSRVSVIGGDVPAREDLSPAELDRYARYAGRAFDLELSRLTECSDKQVRWGHEPYTGPDWNATVFEVACNLLEIVNADWNDLTESDASAALLGAAPRDSGFGEKEIVTCWDSARKTVSGNARSVPSTQKSEGYFIPFEGGGGDVLAADAFFEKGIGLKAAFLGQCVLDLGPLAIDASDNREIWAYTRGVWKRAPHEVERRLTLLLGDRYRVNHETTVLPIIRQRLAADGMVITCDPLPQWVNVRNGMLDWKSGELVAHDPSYLSTVQLPVEWDADATCPRFSAFVKGIMADDADTFLWEIIGYLCYSGNDFQQAILFHGDGGNGKGTLINVLKDLIGTANVATVTLSDIAEGKFETAELYGKIANLAGDIDASYMKTTAKFKAITGEDTVTAQRKYAQPFQFRSWAVPVFSANKLWKSADTTLGYRRRWLLVPFPNTFEINSHLRHDLSTELAGVLVSAVAGLRRLMDRERFDIPDSAKLAKDAFEIASDQVLEWLNDDTSITDKQPGMTATWGAGASSLYVSTSVAYAAYRSWAEVSGMHPVSALEFKNRLAGYGYKVQKSSGVMRIYGLGVDRSKGQL